MIKIGLIGESPYDTKAIKHLMQQKYKEGFHYSILLKNITGNHLDTPKAMRAVVSEIMEQNPDIVVVIRDADALESRNNVIREKKEWYSALSKQMNKKSLLLLNIYELEALILADMDTFNNHYQSQINFTGNAMHIVDPKGFLSSRTPANKKYQPSHCPDLFKILKFETIRKKCLYFNEFINEFEYSLNDHRN